MSAAAAEFNYRVALGTSRIATGIVFASGLATLGLVAALRLSPVIQIGAVAWIATMWIAALGALRRSCELQLHGDDIAVCRRDRWRSGRLCDGSFVSPWLVIVRWRPDGARFDRTVTVLPEMLGVEDFRRLRVYLRWARGRDESLV